MPALTACPPPRPLRAHRVETISTGQYLKRRGELFSRVRVHSLAGLVEEQGDGVESARSQDGLTRKEQRAALLRSRSYILLDLRGEEEYEACSIKTSLHYPVASTVRACWNTRITRFRLRAHYVFGPLPKSPPKASVRLHTHNGVG